MIASAEEFRRLRESENPAEYHRAAHDEAPVEVWLEVIRRWPDMRFWVAHNKTVPISILEILVHDPDKRVGDMVRRKGSWRRHMRSVNLEAEWPFDQPRNCAVFTLRPIVFDGAPILRAVHDEDDHGWQFLGLENADPDQAAVVALEEIVRLDSSVLELADLPPGWHAWRTHKASPWTRERQRADGG